MAATKTVAVKDYLASLPDERRPVVEKVRKLILEHLPKGYKEMVGYGVLTYAIPLQEFPDTYNKQPLAIACLAAKKNYNSLYLMGAYGDSRLRRVLEDGFKKAGKKLDMGKSCVRFTTVDDLPVDTIAKVLAAITPAQYIKLYEASRSGKAPKC